MKRYRQLYAIALTALLALAACSPDAEEWLSRNRQQPPGDGLVSVKVRLQTAGSTSAARTRAWNDQKNATDEEMMNIWTVVICQAGGENDGRVVAVHACRPAAVNSTDTPREQHDDIFRLPAGTYRFYSFANINPSRVLSLLGIGNTAASGSRTRAERNEDGSYDYSGDPFDNENPNDRIDQYSDPTTGNNGKETTDTIIGSSLGTVYDLIPNVKTGATVSANDAAAIAVGISAQGFDPSNVGSRVNSFGVIGIPMSNVQEFTISEDVTKDLIVIRAYAKIQLRIFNETGKPVTISDVKLSDITRSINNNYRLLPSLSQHDNMDATHGDIQPNLNVDQKGVFHYTTSTTVAAEKTVASDKYETITFYVNESTAPLNHFGQFYLGLTLSVGDNPVEYRYALIDGTNRDASDTGKWDYIARNDYRIIPIVLDDYQLDIIPYDFPAIGVYPSSVKGEDGQFTINFHDYGHFHLVPVVKRASTGETLPYVGTTPPTSGLSWGLKSSWADSWRTYDKAGGTLQSSGNYGGFYRDETPSPAVDADDAGGIPVLDTTTKWNGCNVALSNTPFIFGYIADPGGKLTADKTIYHEFEIQLYDGTTPLRTKTCRLYMILDTKQLMYATRRATERRAHD